MSGGDISIFHENTISTQLVGYQAMDGFLRPFINSFGHGAVQSYGMPT
jgi:hypothetical protein